MEEVRALVLLFVSVAIFAAVLFSKGPQPMGAQSSGAQVESYADLAIIP